MTSRTGKAMRYSGRLAKGTARRTLVALAYGLAGALVIVVAAGVYALESRPDLKVWHEVDLEEEYTADSQVSTFEEYLALEDRLFEELDRKVYDRIEDEDRFPINRYHRGSLADPRRWPQNWNRTFGFPADIPSAGIVLLHGMSDSPYSLLSLGKRLHENGAWVIGLRLPGHGTAPSGLVRAQWEDMAAAVRLAMRSLREKIPGTPLYIVGYSNGGALAVEYALSFLEDPSLPRAEGLVLVSPALGVSRLAAFAVWQARLGRLLALRKLAWNALLPEYDPFKYGSFAVNAGDQVYRLTKEIRSRLQRLGPSGVLEDLPPILAFQSAVDATVSTPALVQVLFNSLPEGGHELVLFDINRRVEAGHLLASEPTAVISPIMADTKSAFIFSLVTNRSADESEVVVLRRPPGAEGPLEREIGLSWPPKVYSLSHVSLPFPEGDPLYGGSPAEESPGIQLGNIALQGEKGVLRITAGDMLRLRWNPFYGYLEKRILDFTGLASHPSP